MMKNFKKKELSKNWFKLLRNQIINEFENIENQNTSKKLKFKKKNWKTVDEKFFEFFSKNCCHQMFFVTKNFSKEISQIFS